MRAILLLLLCGAVFAEFADPPLAVVSANNSAAAAMLEGAYNSSYAQNGTMVVRFGSYSQTLNLSASVEIAGMSPSIDNISCATDGLSLIIARGYQQGHLVALPAEGYPDFYCDHMPQSDFVSRCDYDDDDCAEYENRSGVLYDMNATFSFRNVSVTVPASSTLVPVPEEVLAAMESASGNDTLDVNVSGGAVFYYEMNNRSFEFSCGSNITNLTAQVPLSANRSFVVGGSRKLFFLRSPILREQWFRNSRFDVIAMSQCPLYQAEIYMNGNKSANFTLATFYTATDRFGIMSIYSNRTGATQSGWSGGSNDTITPASLERENYSFRFVYEFNHSYSALGEANMSIVVHDSALRQASFNETLTGRMLSFNNMATENGSNLSSVPSRPSEAFRTGSLTQVQIGLGLVAIVLILAFVNFWLVEKV